jgi:hypothetical protein
MYYYYEDGQGAVVVLESISGQPGWTLIPDDLVTPVFTCIAEDRPFRVVNDKLVSGPPKTDHNTTWSWDQFAWVDNRTEQTEWTLVRAERDRRLLASDWTQLPDSPLSTKQAWAVYRQALRDITLQPDPFNIVWPVPPA